MRCKLWFNRPIAISLIAMMLFTISASGCSSTQRIDTDDPDSSYQEFEEKLTDKDVKVSLGGGTSHKGTNIGLNADTTSWTDDESTDTMSIATSDVWRLQTTDHGKGAWKGLLYGTLAGAGIGAVAGIGTEDEFMGGSGAYAAGYGILGGLFGVVIGSLVGYTTTYEINPALAPPPPAKRGSRHN